MENLDLVKATAKAELEEEEFRSLVAKEKTRLKTKKSFWEVLFPFKITIERRKESE